ncbi:hypothetical protein G4B88_017685 [Cannabis sativa]|uniref:RNase H type-1 domain-containing protein n=1 Tax=Cannabis sativa TaxID=3483 RepID=A0A7J6I3S4_CANSA|nr:hypothetical protein G4B88_017685 [Cannabis sativa]
MKLFGWRVCHNWLPAKTNLKHKDMDINTRCDLCGRSEFEDIVKVLWAIWENRNRKWNHLPSMNRQQLMNWLFSAYPKATTTETIAVQKEAGVPPNQKHWIPPTSGCICVNSDAAVLDNVAGVGLGFIWRKADGQLLSAGMIYMHSICSVKMAEAWAILEALKTPPAAETNQIEIQMYCRMLVEEIKDQGKRFTAESNIIHKIHNVLETFTSGGYVAKTFDEHLLELEIPSPIRSGAEEVAVVMVAMLEQSGVLLKDLLLRVDGVNIGSLRDKDGGELETKPLEPTVMFGIMLGR